MDYLAIAVAFDGTCAVRDLKNRLVPVPNAIRVLKKINDSGIGIILHTARTGPALLEASRWMFDYGIAILAVNYNPESPDAGRCVADIYIDSCNLGSPLTQDLSLTKVAFVDWNIVEKLLFEAAVMHHTFIHNLN